MNALAVVLAGHLIGDWIIQTDWQAANKMTSWKANQQHMIGYHVALVGLALLALSLPQALVLGGISWLTHATIDRRWPIIWLMQHTGSRAFSQTTFGVIAVDQALHLSILSLSVAALS